MLAMAGFNPKHAEALWKLRLERREVKTPLDLFLLGYNIMRLHYSSLDSLPSGGKILTLGQDREIDITYEDFPNESRDYITYIAHRGNLSEVLQLPRSTTTRTIDQASLIIKGYSSVWLQRQLTLDSDDEPVSLPVIDDLDVLNAATTARRARKYVSAQERT